MRFRSSLFHLRWRNWKSGSGGRKSEPEEVIQERLAKAANEMKMVPNYKYIVCNDDPKLAAELIETIILRHIELEENK